MLGGPKLYRWGELSKFYPPPTRFARHLPGFNVPAAEGGGSEGGVAEKSPDIYVLAAETIIDCAPGECIVSGLPQGATVLWQRQRRVTL